MNPDNPSRNALKTARLRAVIHGAVQGVGFRPFVHRLANELGLSGFVSNTPQGVVIEAEGSSAQLEQLLLRLGSEKPAPASIHSLEPTWLDPVGHRGFTIRPSDMSGPTTALVMPDIATCPDCLRELRDPSDRRYRYPFTNCTHCGPRFTIIESLPYDRPRTSMKGFTMCERCRGEYEDPANRRFHAQPNACPDCGPQLELIDAGRTQFASRDEALRQAAAALTRGQIVAVKGLGGFHLMAAAWMESAVERLRGRKHREEKPFALMFPSLDRVAEACDVSPLEERLLRSAESPIVILRRREEPCEVETSALVCDSIAPHNPWLGIMLPYTPLHHLLLAEIGRPVVATSGNLADEPICIEESEALDRLAGIADLFLVHNRPILRHADDSIVRVAVGRELVLRRARGYAPLPVPLPEAVPPTLAVGGHFKNTVALAIGRQAFVSQHIGDLESEPAFLAFKRVAKDLESLYAARPVQVAADAHPDFLSTRHARETGLPLTLVQHHHAHVLSCIAENEIRGPVLGVSWDGTGYGTDGSIWGGEFLVVTENGFTRAAHLRTFRLPGGEVAIREPRRSALGLLHELFGGELAGLETEPTLRAFSPGDRKVIQTMLRRGLNSPITSSAGRLFDAVASLLGLRQVCRFEGQAAMELEFAVDPAVGGTDYPLLLPIGVTPPQDTEVPRVLDWEPMVRALLADQREGVALGRIAARFHNTLAESIVAFAKRSELQQVVLTGGCFQNRQLLERTVERLTAGGFRPYWPQRVPPNDGGLALGQLLAVARSARKT